MRKIVSNETKICHVENKIINNEKNSLGGSKFLLKSFENNKYLKLFKYQNSLEVRKINLIM